MKYKELAKEILIILFAAIILSLTISFPSQSLILQTSIFFIIILGLNVAVKKMFGYYFEADVRTKFWEWHNYWFRKDTHFKKPIPMLWLAPLISLISRGMLWWLAILEFDVKPKTERVSKRHGLYRFSEMTDWHIALLATAGVVANLVLAIIGYVSASWVPSLELFAKLNIYYAAWSLLPISSLDGSKIFFGSKALWFTMLVIVAIFLGFSFMVV